MIELTEGMRAKVRTRMGIPPGDLLDPWLEGALRDVLDDVDRTYRISDTRHLIHLSEEGWVIQHPMSCRPKLYECQWNNIVALIWDDDEDKPPGLYVGQINPGVSGGQVLYIGDLVTDTEADAAHG